MSNIETWVDCQRVKPASRPEEPEELKAQIFSLEAQLASTRADLHMSLKTIATQQDEIDTLRETLAKLKWFAQCARNGA